MTYAGFHFRFNLPVLLAACVLGGERFWSLPGLATAVGILVIVMLFTSPWDNYAAKWGIWGFAEGRYWKKWKYLPVEEYAFFIIQSLQAMGLAAWLCGVLGPYATEPHPWTLPTQGVILGAGLVVWLVVGWLGKRIGPASRAHYTWHLLYWFAPVILAQWVIGLPVLVERWAVLALVTLGLSTYLSMADWVAIRHGIWFFDEKQTTGWKIGGVMPWEEAAFFYLTSLLVAQSWLILAPEALRG